MKTVLLMTLMLSPGVAIGGPKYSYDDSKLNDEMNNIYKEIGHKTATRSTTNTANINGTFMGLGRNRILNGDMRIDQVREGTAYSTIVGGSLAGGGTAGGQAFYALDQWRFEATVSSTFTILRTNEALPNGLFSQAMRISVISSATVGSGDAANMEYPMDPLYQQDWGWGTSSAVPITLQFWVLSSSAGIHSIAFINGVNSRSYVSTYSISTANTWQKEVITISGDTSGNTSNWPSSGTVFGLKVVWDMGSGSGVTTSTLNQWQSASVWKASTADNFTNALASVYFTGIQLEIGQIATEFEYMPYDDQLHRLQKYFWKSFAQGTVVAQSGGIIGPLGYITYASGTAGASGLQVQLPVPMLATPTVTTYNPASANAKWRNQSAVSDSGSPTIYNAGSTGFYIYNPQVAGDSSAGQLISIHAIANSRLGGS